jgi:hypothetical protein
MNALRYVHIRRIIRMFRTNTRSFNRSRHGIPPLVLALQPFLTQVHHQLWEWAKVGLSDKVDPAVHVYPHHKDGLFDPLATPKTPIREESSDDEANSDNENATSGGDDDAEKKKALKAAATAGASTAPTHCALTVLRRAPLCCAAHNNICMSAPTHTHCALTVLRCAQPLHASSIRTHSLTALRCAQQTLHAPHALSICWQHQLAHTHLPYPLSCWLAGSDESVVKGVENMTITVNDSDEGIGAGAETEAVVDDVVGHAYIVILSDQSNVLRQGAYWDVKTPFRTLP